MIYLVAFLVLSNAITVVVLTRLHMLERMKLMGALLQERSGTKVASHLSEPTENPVGRKSPVS